MTYHGLAASCPKCGRKLYTTEVFGRADGQVLLECVCTCGECVEIAFSFANILNLCRRADAHEPFDLDEWQPQGRAN